MNSSTSARTTQPHLPTPRTGDQAAGPVAASTSPVPPSGSAVEPTPAAVWPVGPLTGCRHHHHCHLDSPADRTDHRIQDSLEDRPEDHIVREGTDRVPVCAAQLPDRLLHRIVGAYSRAGDVVLISDAGTGAAVGACVDFDRGVIARVPHGLDQLDPRWRTVIDDARHETGGDWNPVLDDEHAMGGRLQRLIAVFTDRLHLPGRGTARTEAGRRPPGQGFWTEQPTGHADTAGDGQVLRWPAAAREQPAHLLVIPSPCAADPTLTAAAAHDAATDRAIDLVRDHLGGTVVDDEQDGLDEAGAWQLRVLREALPLLAPDAIVVLHTTATRNGDGALVDRTGPLIDAAHALGLAYLQHVVAVHADITDGQLRLRPRRTTSATGTGAPSPVHAPAHSDLIVLALTGAAL